MRGVDLKYPEYASTEADEFLIRDSAKVGILPAGHGGVDDVYALAADMGGMGYISSHHAEILHNNLLISTHTIEAARENKVSRYLYTSSACVYPEYRQTERGCRAVEGGGRLSRTAAGRIRLGKADCRTSLPSLRRRLRNGRPHRALPQHLRPARHMGRRPREGAGRALQESGDREADRLGRNRNLGRRRANALVLLHRRLRRGPHEA